MPDKLSEESKNRILDNVAAFFKDDNAASQDNTANHLEGITIPGLVTGDSSKSKPVINIGYTQDEEEDEEKDKK